MNAKETHLLTVSKKQERNLHLINKCNDTIKISAEQGNFYTKCLLTDTYDVQFIKSLGVKVTKIPLKDKILNYEIDWSNTNYTNTEE